MVLSALATAIAIGTWDTPQWLLLLIVIFYIAAWRKAGVASSDMHDVTVNGRDVKVNADSLGYRDILALARMPIGGHLSVTWRSDVATGSLDPGDRLGLKGNGHTIISVANTSAA